MYKVKYGGKKGKTLKLVESPDLFAVRTKDNQSLEDVNLSAHGREVLQDSSAVAEFPDAGVSVRRVNTTDSESGFEAITARDEARATLKQEEEIRFAGRVLQDEKTGEVMLYTENFFLKFKDPVPEADCVALIEKYHLTVKDKLVFATNSWFVKADEGTGLKVFEIADTLLTESIVEYCHPELVQQRRFKAIHPLQWHLKKTEIAGKSINHGVNIERAWEISRGKGITIAIVDDGVDVDHPEFAGKIVHPRDVTQGSDDPRPKDPDDNHGTACAGVACAVGLDGGASGTAPDAKLMPIRLRSGLGSMAEANAFVWAADHGADVISCSWGPEDGEWWNPSDAKHKRQNLLPDSSRLAMEYALTKGRGGRGCVILFAAGNGNEETKMDGYASYPGVITVAACNDTGKRSVYSDYGKEVWVSFPSGDFAYKPFKHPAPISEGIRTTDRVKNPGYSPENYTNAFGGTSSACPGMAGVVGLMLAANPNLTPSDVKEIIRRSCVVLDKEEGEWDDKGHSIYYGYGRIDAGLAVENARKATQQAEPGPSVEGTAKFTYVGDVQVRQGQMTGNVPGRKLVGFSLRLKPGENGLKLRYKANVSGSIVSGQEGEYVGALNGRKNLIGFALELEGGAASDYEVEYSARLKDSSEAVLAKNGAFCGSNSKSGKTVEGFAVSVRKK